MEAAISLVHQDCILAKLFDSLNVATSMSSSSSINCFDISVDLVSLNTRIGQQMYYEK